MRTTTLSLLFISLFGYIRAGPTCIRCTDAAEIAECITNTAECGDNEQCYLEKVTKEDLSIRYNAGCRSTAVCQIMASLNTGKRKRELVNCADCCADAPNENGPCNAALCGLKPTALQATCVVCNGVHSDVRSCTSAATCPPNEACFTGIRIVGTAIRYVFGCYEERVCRAFIGNENVNSTINRPGRVIHGDQGISICDACCKGDRCNAADCFELKKKMPGIFSSTTPGANPATVVSTAPPIPTST